MQKYDLFCKRKKNWVEKMPSKSDFMTYVNGFALGGGGVVQFWRKGTSGISEMADQDNL